MDELRELGPWIDKGPGIGPLLDAENIILVRQEGVLYSNNPARAQEINAGHEQQPDPIYIDAYEWVNRVPPKRLGEIAKAMSQPGLEEVLGGYYHVLAKGRVNLADPNTKKSLDALTAAGVISPDERALLLSK